MKKLNTIILSLILAMGLNTTSQSFEGLSVGAIYSSVDFSTKGSETMAGAIGSNTTNTTTKTGSDDIGAIFAEYTFAQGSTIGIEYIDGSAEIGKASRTETGTTSGTVTVKAEAADPITFYVEPTFMLSDTFGIYLKGGATRVSIEPKEVADSGNVVTSTYKAKDVWGVNQGFGAKYYMGQFFAKAEYTETEFGTYSHQSTTGNLGSISADIDTEETRFALGYNF